MTLVQDKPQQFEHPERRLTEIIPGPNPWDGMTLEW
jgi:hypothetical protein